MPSDNHINAKTGNGSFWPFWTIPGIGRSSCEKVMGLPELAHDERFKDKGSAIKNSLALYKHLEEAFLSKTSDEWTTLFTEHDIAFERIRHYADVSKDPQAWANGFLFEHHVQKRKYGHPPPDNRCNSGVLRWRNRRPGLERVSVSIRGKSFWILAIWNPRWWSWKRRMLSNALFDRNDDDGEKGRAT